MYSFISHIEYYVEILYYDKWFETFSRGCSFSYGQWWPWWEIDYNGERVKVGWCQAERVYHKIEAIT